MLNLTGFRAVRDCLPTRWHPLLDEIVMDASAEQLILDPQLNEIGKLGAGRTGIVVDRQVLRHRLLTGLTVHTDAALTGYDMLADGNVQAQFSRYLQRNGAHDTFLTGTPTTAPPRCRVRGDVVPVRVPTGAAACCWHRCSCAASSTGMWACWKVCRPRSASACS